MLTLKEMAKQSSKLPKYKTNFEAMRKWVYDKMENSDMTHAECKAAFVKRFGAGHDKYFETLVTDFMG